jgi:hypothetical protein
VERIKHAMRAAFVGEDLEWRAAWSTRAIVHNAIAELRVRSLSRAPSPHPP